MTPEALYERIKSDMPGASSEEQMEAFWASALELADTDLSAAVKMTILMVRNQTDTASRDYRRLNDLAIAAFNS